MSQPVRRLTADESEGCNVIRAKKTKRAMGLWLAMLAAGGALLAATPSSAERTGQVRASVREQRVMTAAPRAAAPSQFNLLGDMRSVRPRADELGLDARRVLPKDEPVFEPWSLIALGLSVMVFIARRRRSH